MKTISYDDETLFDRQMFFKLHDHILASYPKINDQLELEIVNDMTLLFCWKGSDPGLKPVALLHHLDVVPVEKASWKKWDADPLSGDILNGYIYGRGALDDKGAAMSTLEAVELLLSNGFKFRRADGYENASGSTYIYMAFAEAPFVTAGTKAAGTAR